ncbi:3-deoxy-7-phosphoheptulonate synthase [Marinobacter sp.]|uniref:3-deoxy-7-phosphoheptulonate synthase n=1 Tax=Marinobacter sp. TaxID=50741 RepID=UPI00385023A7
MNMPLSPETTGRADALSATTPETASSQRETLLPTAFGLQAELPASKRLRSRIDGHREAIKRIFSGEDTRTLVVIGPCSIHDEVAALEYAERLGRLAGEISDRFLVVMRAYLEKPRTTVGWKGLLYDPERTGAGDLAQGLVRSRRLLLNLGEMGLPLATEALSPMAMDYLGDLVSWTAIGARTTESQIHREMVSGLPMPVGFKNGTDGSVAAAVNAMKSAAHSHHRLGVTSQGAPAMITTAGNRHTHLVLRGGHGVTNYDASSIGEAVKALTGAGLHTGVMVDCSHDNARKQPARQLDIARDVMAQKAAGNASIRGLMLESFLQPGRQDDGPDLIHGCSLTDPCIGWEQTEALLTSL